MYLLNRLKVSLTKCTSIVSAVFITASLVVPSVASAQVGVRDSSPVKPPATSAPAAQPSTNSNFIYELQILRQEILSLRGTIEEQAYEIKRLKQQRLDDYLDLDKRITALSSANPDTSATDGASIPATLPIETGLPVSSAEESEAEKALYGQAIDRLLNKQDYSGAEADFTQYLTNYPKGQYVPNVFYWQGQISLTQGKEEVAASTFERLVTEYPNSPKASDAQFKLARIYYNQGKRKEARAILDDVAASNTEASPLAKSFIEKNF